MRRLAALLLTLCLAAPAAAEVPVEGTFVVARDCPALLSIRKGTNPGEVRVAPGQRLPAVALNRRDGDHVRLRLPGAPVETRRWVALDCGRLEAPQAAAVKSDDPASRDNLLAASWLPAFCERNARRPECRTLDDRPAPAAARAFSLHGLWPQPRGNTYCGDSAGLSDTRWSDLPFPGVDRETAEAMLTAMPGVVSRLHRHQWAKHGSCYGAAGGADEYFDDSIHLLEQLNDSALGALFADGIGRHLTPEAIRAAADDSFGPGAGDRIETVCADGLIVELRLNLAGPIEAGETPLGDLLRAARPAPRGCGGVVDAP